MISEELGRRQAVAAVVVLTCVIFYFSGIYTFIVNDVLSTAWQRMSPRCDYVGFEIPKDRLGLGNYMFLYSAVTYVAAKTGRRPCIWTTSTRTRLDRVFDLDLEYVDINTLGCPLYRFSQWKNNVVEYDLHSLVNRSAGESLVLQGYFHKRRYVKPIAEQLRRKLKFRREIAQFADEFLAHNVPPGWNRSTFVRVGIHVRRGDFLDVYWRSYGFNVADELYIRRAMRFIVRRFRRVQFIVASNDIRWSQKHVAFNSSEVNITFSVGQSAGEDLALLASCDHTVITTGTFGWWAAWLANGITVYYANHPRHGSLLGSMIHHDAYYPPQWIGIDDNATGCLCG